MGRNLRGTRTNLDLARVLVVDDNPAARLTLQTVLEAGGYAVDSAATAAEAVGKLEDEEYELVLSDMHMESPQAGLKVLAHAHLMEYQPATAIVNTTQDCNCEPGNCECGQDILVRPDDVPGLLASVANLLADRVNRIVGRELRQSRN